MAPLTAGSALRWSRAAVVAGAATLLGTTAHVLAGGLVPAAGVMVAMLATLTVWAAVAMARPVGRLALAAMVGGGQLVVHLVLTITAGHSGDGALPHASGLAHTIGHLRDDLSGPHAVMTVGHLAAATATALWLAAGERALWTLIALVGRRAIDRVLAFVPRSATSSATRGTWQATTPWRRRQSTQLLASSVSRRGPPLGPLEPLPIC